MGFYINDAGEGGLRQWLHFGKVAPFPCTPTPRRTGQGRPNKKEQTVGLHFDFARRLSQSYILKLLDRRRTNALSRQNEKFLFGQSRKFLLTRATMAHGRGTDHDEPEAAGLVAMVQAKRKQITQATAAKRMGVSERWVRKLLQRMKREKDRVVVHGLRGQASNRRLAEASRARAVEIIRREYADFGPTLAAEYLAERHELKVSKETLRGWMTAAGIWKAKKRRVVEIHTWRPRHSYAGELVQWDTSEHDWLEGRGERLYLIAMIDDATSQAIARFAHHDSTLENLRLLRDYLQRWGRPLELYTDQARLFTNAPGWNREAKGEPPKTQIGRALEELGIGWIPAYSPQAKGRQERFFGTHKIDW
jgi:transposase